MARDPAEGDAFVFDLVGGDAPSADALAAGGPADGERAEEGARTSAVPGRKRRAAAQVAAVLAIVLGTGLATDGARDHARAERMRDVPGGVADLSSPPAPAWTWTGDAGGGGNGADVAVLGGALVVEAGDELVALDPVTGEADWTVALRDDADCGPMDLGRAVRYHQRTSALVCLQGAADDREVVVVRPDGATDARRLDAADSRRYGPPRTGPDGTVLRARRVGPPSVVDVGDVECGATGECSGTVRAGRDLALRAEDAVTGAERWSVVVPFRPASATQCARTFHTSWGGSEARLVISGELAPDAFGARVTAGLVDLNGCGIAAAVTPRGAVLGTDAEPGLGGVVRLGAAGYAAMRFDGVPRATLYSPEGRAVGQVTGYPLAPQATDRRGPGTVLAVDEPGRRLRAYAVDGTPRWDIALQSGGQQFLAQVGDTAVVSTGAGSVRGLDLATGEERWAWDGSTPSGERDGGYFGTAHVVQTFTDGETVLLVTEGDVGEAQGLVALDADSGTVVWERSDDRAAAGSDPAPDGPGELGVVGSLMAVDGVLLEVTANGVRGFE